MVTVVSDATDMTVSKLMNGETEVSKLSGANWSASSDNKTVTIKKAYLSTLSAGDVTLTLTFSKGESHDIVITVVDAE